MCDVYKYFNRMYEDLTKIQSHDFFYVLTIDHLNCFQALETADLVVEAVVENMGLKQKLFK